jgi:cytoskeleton protein RodZ
VFAIGSSLREARERQGIELVDAEAATKVRAKYLRALEDESFDMLPGETYVKGFMRSYADYLGLDGQLYVDEFNSRFASGEDDLPTVTRPRRQRPSAGGRQIEATVVLVALAGIAAVTALVVVAWKWGDSRDERPPAVRPPPAATTKERKAQPAPWFGLRVQAVFGDTQLTVRRGTARGPVLYNGNLPKGRQVVRQGQRLWVKIGSPANVVLRLRGRPLELPDSVGSPAVFFATAKAIKPAR